MSATGDKAGYVVLVQDRRTPESWNETPSGIFTRIIDAVNMVNVYEDRQEGAEYQDVHAVARLELVMISRPNGKETS